MRKALVPLKNQTFWETLYSLDRSNVPPPQSLVSDAGPPLRKNNSNSFTAKITADPWLLGHHNPCNTGIECLVLTRSDSSWLVLTRPPSFPRHPRPHVHPSVLWPGRHHLLHCANIQGWHDKEESYLFAIIIFQDACSVVEAKDCALVIGVTYFLSALLRFQDDTVDINLPMTY